MVVFFGRIWRFLTFRPWCSAAPGGRSIPIAPADRRGAPGAAAAAGASGAAQSGGAPRGAASGGRSQWLFFLFLGLTFGCSTFLCLLCFGVVLV